MEVIKERNAVYIIIDSDLMDDLEDEPFKVTLAANNYYWSDFFLIVISITLLIWLALAVIQTGIGYNSVEKFK